MAFVLTLLSAVMLACFGHEDPPMLAAAAFIDRLLLAGWPAAVYIIAACGMGVAASRVVLPATASMPARCALGVGLMLTLSHAMGVVGAFGGPSGPWMALLPILLGLACGAMSFRRSLALRAGLPRLHPVWLAATPAAGVLLLAAANPPGWLWESEFRGYDALSYHLALPQEWIAAGALRPLTHNVYSFLPSYIEAAFYHLGALTHAPAVSRLSPGLPGPLSVEPAGLLAGDGWRLLSCQFLHAGLTIISVWWIADTCARLVRLLAPSLSPSSVSLAQAAAGASALATPWMIVVGSLAYNDAVAAGFVAGGINLVLPGESNPKSPAASGRWHEPILAFARAGHEETVATLLRRVGVCAFLCGIAGSIKPTALLLAAPIVGVMLLLSTPARRWALTLAAGCFVGLLCLAPWLARNDAASGNPVFPFAAWLFPNADGGTGHWTAEQVATFSKGHTFDRGVADRLRLMLLPDPTDPAGERHRGLLHGQWWAFWPMVLAACIVLLAAARTRCLGVILTCAALMGLCGWLWLTHVQSRFLLPLLPIGAAAIGAACAALATLTHSNRAGLAAAASLVLVQTLGTVRLFLGQHQGRPNELLVAGPPLRSGEIFRHALAGAPREEAEVFMREAAPEMFCNIALPAGARLSLIGGATPLYYTRPVIYNTTWDHWPIADVLDAWKDGRPHDDAQHLGAHYLLIDLGEIKRLHASGWAGRGVDEGAVSAWMRARTELIRAWPEAGIYLVRLADPPASAGGSAP